MAQEWDAQGKPIQPSAGGTEWDANGKPLAPAVAGAGPLGTPQPQAHPPVSMQTSAAGHLGAAASLVQSFGEQVAPQITHPGQGGVPSIADALGGPAYAAGKGVVQGAMRSGGEISQAIDAHKQGNDASAGIHAVKAIPFIGPAMDRGADQYADKDYAGEAGTLLGGAAQAAPFLTDAAVAGGGRIADAIPTRSHAAGVFNDIENAAKDVPVRMQQTQPALDQFSQSVKTGGKNSPVITKLQKRIDEPGLPEAGIGPAPIKFPEARDFYTNISRETAKPGLLRRAIENPRMPSFRMEVGNVREGLSNDLTDAADTIGRGKDYTDASTEYRRAARLNKAVKVGGTLAAGEAARRTGLLGKVAGGVANAAH